MKSQKEVTAWLLKHFNEGGVDMWSALQNIVTTTWRLATKCAVENGPNPQDIKSLPIPSLEVLIPNYDPDIQTC
jgi:hypothetical protein